MSCFRRAFVTAFAVISLAASAPLSFAQEGPAWTRYESKEHQFEVEFPAKDVQVDSEEVVTHYYAAMAGNDTDFRVGISAIAADPSDKEAVLTELKRIRDTVVTNMGATLSGESDIALGERAGIHFDLATTASGTELDLTCRYFIAHKRLYQVMVVRTKGTEMTEEIKKFFDSFKILD